jgi:hypothetical protein
LISNQGLLSAFWRPLNLSGREFIEKLLLTGNQGCCHCHAIHFQQFNFIMGCLEANFITQDPELGLYISAKNLAEHIRLWENFWRCVF